MYTNPQQGQMAADTATAQKEATRLSELRFMVLDTVNYSAYTTAEEKANTAASVAKCQSAETLVKWYCNLLTLLSERELAAPAAAEAAPATTEQKQEIVKLLNHPAISRARKSKELVRLNHLTDAQAVALIAELTSITHPTPPTRPAGAGLVVNGRGQLTLSALTRYANKVAAAAGGVAVSYVQAA
jgi:hypothetical protein